MSRKGVRFLRCPDCGKRGVWGQCRPVWGDNYQCRYCEWYAYSNHTALVDIREMERLRDANPEDAATL